MPRVLPTPLRLAKLELIGAFITLIALLGLYLPWNDTVVGHGMRMLLWSERFKLLFVVLPLLSGTALTYYNNHRLSSGVNHLRFTEDELDEARHFVNRPWVTSVQLITILVVGVLLAVQSSVHTLARVSPVLFLMSTNPLNNLRSTLRKPLPKSAPIDWGRVQPIHSDHWGPTT